MAAPRASFSTPKTQLGDPSSHPALQQPRALNLGTGEEISIRDLIALICELMGFQGEIRWRTDKPNGQPRRCLDVSKAREKIGFVAKVGLREGLQRTIDWYRRHASQGAT